MTRMTTNDKERLPQANAVAYLVDGQTVFYIAIAVRQELLELFAVACRAVLWIWTAIADRHDGTEQGGVERAKPRVGRDFR